MESRFDDDDAMLDAALASYGAGEPLAGLEERILNRLRNALPVQRRRRNALLIAAGMGLAALGVLAILVHQRPPVQKPITMAVLRPVAPPAMLRSQQAAGRAVSVEKSRRVRRQFRRAMPKLLESDLNGMVRTPTAEERSVFRFVQENPEIAKVIFASFESAKGQPLEIQPLEITPLGTEVLDE